jgi:hypothetical protein
MNEINLKDVSDEMKGVYLVSKIYEIHNYFNENEEKNYDIILLNENLLEMIDSINFIYVKDGLEPSDYIKKVGYLLNLFVYLDPKQEENYIIFTNDQKDSKLKVNVIL